VPPRSATCGLSPDARPDEIRCAGWDRGPGHRGRGRRGVPAFRPFLITGLPDAALGEARDRVRAAINNSGLPFSLRRLTVNLSPASLPKTGTSFDLTIYRL